MVVRVMKAYYLQESYKLACIGDRIPLAVNNTEQNYLSDFGLFSM